MERLGRANPKVHLPPIVLPFLHQRLQGAICPNPSKHFAAIFLALPVSDSRVCRRSKNPKTPTTPPFVFAFPAGDFAENRQGQAGSKIPPPPIVFDFSLLATSERSSREPPENLLRRRLSLSFPADGFEAVKQDKPRKLFALPIAFPARDFGAALQDKPEPHFRRRLLLSLFR